MRASRDSPLPCASVCVCAPNNASNVGPGRLPLEPCWCIRLSKISLAWFIQVKAFKSDGNNAQGPTPPPPSPSLSLLACLSLVAHRGLVVHTDCVPSWSCISFQKDKHKRECSKGQMEGLDVFSMEGLDVFSVGRAGPGSFRAVTEPRTAPWLLS